MSAEGLPGRLERFIASRTVWVTDQRRDLDGSPSARPAFAAVVGREHYVERRRRYPIDARRDLERVLAQELQGRPDTLTAIGPAREGGREVSFFELKPEASSLIGRTFFVVPEGLVLAGTLGPGQIAGVQRSGFRYFLSGSGISQPAGGAVGTPELFATAIGQYGGEGTVAIDEAELRRRLPSGLRRIPIGTWLGLRRSTTRQPLDIDWRKLGTWSAIALAGYLTVASAYLELTTEARERELATLGAEVDSLLAAQNRIEKVGGELAAIDGILSERRDTYRLWAVVNAAWSKGAAINRIVLKDTQLTIYGTAPMSTDVLSAVAATAGVANARFSSPVRSIGERLEEFALTLTLAAGAGKRG
jgi:hypothetical protein